MISRMRVMDSGFFSECFFSSTIKAEGMTKVDVDVQNEEEGATCDDI